MRGQWIGCGSCDAPLIRGEFNLDKKCSMSIHISGLGFFELYMNGQKVSDDVLVPVWSDYSSRKGQRLKYPIHDERSYHVFYCRYDISDLLQEGTNVIEVLLGNGWYHQCERMAEGEMWYGQPKLWFEMIGGEGAEKVDICSGTWLTWRPSEIIFNNIYIGETQDFTAPVQEWRPVEEVEAPEGELRLQECPADRVIRKINPKYLGEIDGRKIYDAGENITGWILFTEQGADGEVITVRYAEELDEEGKLDFESTGGLKQVQRDVYVSAGEKCVCEPHFTWHGFRYFDIEGEAQDIIVQVVHSDVKVTGHFRCSDPTINWLVDAYVRSRLGNMHCGVPSDCPHRERLGYTGDGQAICGTDFWMLDADAFYRKWIEDIAAGQCRISGHVQHTAPFYGGGGGPGGWGGAMVLVPWEHFRRYRDKELLEKYYPNMCSYLRYMFSRRDEQGMVVREEERGWCLGDWCAPDKMELPADFVNTYFLIRCLMIVRQIADILDKECPYTEEDIEIVKQCLKDKYYDGGKNCFADNAQGADAYALDIGMGNEEMAATMAMRYEQTQAFDTGFLATGILIRQLFQQGYGETAVTLLKSDVEGHSYGWQRKQGATTLWERWQGIESRNHPMFGSPVQMLFEGLLGIQTLDGLRIKPFFSKQLSMAEGSAETIYGIVSVKWKRQQGKMELELNLPCEAEVVFGEEQHWMNAGEYKLYIDESNDRLKQ